MPRNSDYYDFDTVEIISKLSTDFSRKVYEDEDVSIHYWDKHTLVLVKHEESGDIIFEEDIKSDFYRKVRSQDVLDPSVDDWSSFYVFDGKCEFVLRDKKYKVNKGKVKVKNV